MVGMSNYLRRLWNRPNYAIIVLIVKKEGYLFEYTIIAVTHQ